VNNLNITGSDYDTTLVGNAGDNLLRGGGGGDRLTGGLGRDTFVFAALSDSMLINPVTGLSGMDWITDLAIGTDIIQGLQPIAPNELLRRSSNESLSGSALSALLPAADLPALGGAVVTTGVGSTNPRTFLVLNDAVAGYDPSQDSLIELTGYTGQINDLRVI
jgi:hypothetical protein